MDRRRHVHGDQPPPNPAKTTDGRYAGYRAKYGKESWELDALPPQVIADLIQKSVEQYLMPQAWKDDCTLETEQRNKLKMLSKKKL